MPKQHFNHTALSDARLGLGMTQNEAAELLRIDEATYRRYESGRVNGPEGFQHPLREEIRPPSKDVQGVRCRRHCLLAR